MLTDPQSVTINAVPFSLPRIPSATGAGVYQSSDGNVRLTISHQYSGQKTRSLVRIDHRKIAEDPLAADRNLNYKFATHLVIERPNVGYSAAECKQIVDGLMAALSASSGAMITKVLGGEA